MADASRLESMWRYATIVSAIVAATVGISQYRRGVSQSIRELEWRQADMARTLINVMMADEGWQAMTVLDWEKGRGRAEAHRDTTIYHGPIRPVSVPSESVASGGTLGPRTKGRCTVSARVVRREAALPTQEAALRVHGRELHD